MTKIIIILISLFNVYCAYSQKKYSLEECVSIANSTNRSIKQTELLKQKSYIELKQARNSLFPTINADLNYNRNSILKPTSAHSNTSTYYWGLNSGIQLFDGLKSIYEIKYRKNELSISDFNLLYQKQLIRDEITYSYIKILLNEELSEMAFTQLKLTDSLLYQRKILLKQGRIGQGELLELHAQRAKEEFEHTLAINNLLISKLELTQLLEIEYDSLFSLSKLDDEYISNEIYHTDSLYITALKNRANIKSAELLVESNKINSSLIKSRFYPNLSAGFVAGENYMNESSKTFSTRVYVMATIPIFDKFETKNLLQKNKVQTKLAELNLLNERMELYKAIEQAKYNTLATKAKWESAQKSEKISLEVYNYMKIKYESGKSTVYELYHTKTNLTLQNSSALQAKYEYYLQLIMINNLTK